MPLKPDRAARLARLLESELSAEERAGRFCDEDEELVATFADALATQADLEREDAASAVAPTPDALVSDRPKRRRRPEQRRSNKRWCIPPAVMRPYGETLEGQAVLEEHEDPRLGYLLWASLRDVLIWTRVGEDRRGGLYEPRASENRMALIRGAGVAHDLEASLVNIAVMLSRPDGVDQEVISQVCLAVSRWARDRAAWATGVAFAQAAAEANPDDPGPALAVGALLRTGYPADLRALDRAATWLLRSVGLARRAGDWQKYAEAYVELGALFAKRNKVVRAARYYFKAARAARRNGFRYIRAAALHGMMRLTVETGELLAGEKFGRSALRAYGRRNIGSQAVLHDLATLWVQGREYGRALPILKRQLELRHKPRERALTLALLAHAHAGLGLRGEYQRGAAAAWAIIEEGNENHARALLQLAYAADAMKDWDAVDRAVSIQAERQHADKRVAVQLAELLTYGRPTKRIEESK